MKPRQVLARNLRVMRKQKGLSQDDLAFQTGINRNDVSQVECEKINEPMDVGFPDADAPGVRIRDLCSLTFRAHPIPWCNAQILIGSSL